MVVCQSLVAAAATRWRTRHPGGAWFGGEHRERQLADPSPTARLNPAKVSPQATAALPHPSPNDPAQASPHPTEVLAGSIERVTFQNADSGFGAYQERSPLRVLLSAPHELYSESSVMGFCFVKSQSTRS